MKSKAKKEKKPLTEKEEKRKIIVRAVLLGVAITVAVVAFSIAMKAYIHKDPDFYTIDADRAEEALLYANGITLTCYFDGSSNEIRQAMNTVRGEYSATLLRLYKLLDPVNEYDGFVNLAYLNNRVGEDVELSLELYDILNSAYALTVNGRFNMFAGALWGEWQGITVLDEQAEFDPLFNENEAQRISAIAACVGDISNFDYQIIDAENHIVRVTVSEEYKQLQRELELTAPLIDLAYLREAFEIEYTAAAVEKTGYTNGYFVTDEGLAKAMCGVNGGSFLIHSVESGLSVKACLLDIGPSMAFCEFKAFPVTDQIAYYSVEHEGETLMRHPHFDYADGGMHDTLISACAVNCGGDLVSAAIDSYCLITLADPADAAAFAKSHAGSVSAYYYILKAEPKTVYADPAHAGDAHLDEESVAEIKPIG